MQYSDTITLEYSFREIQSKESIIEKVRSIPYQGGKATNTGHALDYISKHTFTSANGGRQNVPHLVYMVSSNPSTDVIIRHPTSINVIPIGITPRANVQELRMISQPNRPIILQSYSTLIEEAPELVLQSCCSHKTWTEIPGKVGCIFLCNFLFPLSCLLCFYFTYLEFLISQLIFCPNAKEGPFILIRVR